MLPPYKPILRARTLTACLLLAVLLAGCGSASHPPNLVVIFADDLGYGDLGVYGHPTIRTPHLDRMAEEGMKLTQFYAAASVCTPSRAALLTGRLPVRSGMASDERRVLFPDSKLGLPDEEITIAEALKGEGYATACVGKWHLGHREPYLPTNNGFDAYFGIPYSNDMSPATNDWEGAQQFPPIPLMRGTEVVEREPDQRTLTRRYTEEAVQFIRDHQDRPFFLYLAHTFPHVPLFASEAFQDTSRRGLYGDVVEEIDWSTGEVLSTLKNLGLAENTLVLFTSDNGPWLIMDEEGGSAGLLRGGKGSTWEGGMREPTIAWWPGTIRPEQVSPALTSTLDVFPTALALAGVKQPNDHVVDGINLLPLLRGEQENGREAMYYYRGEQLYAVRKGPWKAHFITQAGYGDEPAEHDPPLLYHLEHDPSEQYNLADEHPEVIDDLREMVKQHRANLEPRPSQLEARLAASAAPAD